MVRGFPDASHRVHRRETRDFIYIEDVVRANVLPLTAEKAVGELMNIGTGKRISINKLYEVIEDILRTGIKPKYGPPRPCDIKHSVADVSLAHGLLRYQTTVQFADGLKKSIEWTKQNLM